MEIFKRKDFARWQVGQRLTDSMLCKAVEEMRRGLVDASLGGELFKQRIAGRVFLELSSVALCRALQSGVLMEVCCEQQTD
jgi:hypothetical protein